MTAEDKEKLIAQLEALLFIHGEPMSVSAITTHTNNSEEDVLEAVNELEKRLEDLGRGLKIINSGGKLQLVTKKEYAGVLEKFVKDELSEDLTPAALETVSIIAYLGPITRARIEYLRGVNSTFTIRNLMLRGIIERVSSGEKGGGVCYQLAPDALRHLGVSSSGELPLFEETKMMLSKIEGKEEEKPVEETAETAMNEAGQGEEESDKQDEIRQD